MTLRPRSPSATPVRLHTPLRATAAAARTLCGAWTPHVLGLLGVLLMAGAPQGDARAQAAGGLPRNLPNPCSVTNACDYKGVPITDFTKGNTASIVTSGKQMTVTQNVDTALMNWRSFDIAAGNTVTFNRTGDQAFVAINRIHDTQASNISGNLFAPKGQVYLINPNGLMFGKTAVVDVAGLIASTLDIDDGRITKGLLGMSTQQSVFAAVDPVLNPNAATAAVKVEQGAVLKAGNVYVFAPNVDNAGSIQVTSGGQVVLAAGQRVFLAGSDDVTLRGLLVEVGQGGTVTHSGDIQTPRGNTTLVGMAVNQDGRITATSALNQNGSIRLLAREVTSAANVPPNLSPSTKPAGMFLQASATGAVDMKSGSSTKVLLDTTDTATAPLSDATAAAARSTITIEGARVNIGGSGAAGSTLVQAHGGDVKVSARTDVRELNGVGAILGAEDRSAIITVGADAKIDVSGERDVKIDGNRNYVYIDRLTSNDLRDSPLQRDGFLRGEGVYVNVAKDQAFIDLTSRRDAVAGTQAERNAVGGNIVLRAEGGVNAAQGSQFDMSGGTTQTSAATGRTSQLLTADGRVVDIMNARADERYVGFADRYTQALDAPREGLSGSVVYEAPRITGTAAFAEGRSAGTLEIVAPRASFAGTVSAGTTPGAGQRANLPLGGQIRIGTVGTSKIDIDHQLGFSRANVLLTDDLAGAGTAVPGAQQDRLIAIDTTMLKAGGVSRIDVLSDGYVTVAKGAAIDAGPGGSIALRGNAVDVNASLTARGGSIAVGERPLGVDSVLGRLAKNLVATEERGRVRFGSGVALDASGLFTNDTKTPAGTVPTSAVVRDGGSIDISGGQVDVSGVTRFDVDAGASVSAAGAVTGGKAGSIGIAASDRTVGNALTDQGRLTLGDDLAGRLSAFGFASGGSLAIGAPVLTVGAQAVGDAVRIDTAVFDRGFEKVTLRGADQLTVQAGTTLAPQVRQYVADMPLRALASGTDLSSALVPQKVLPANQRGAEINLSASGINGRLTVEAGARVDAGVQGKINLNAGQSIVLDGQLVARGGNVNLALAGPAVTDPTFATVERLEHQAIQLGNSSLIDVSGVSRVQADALGLRSGSVLDGGSVSVGATLGSLGMAAGAQIRADGAHDQVDLRGAGAATRVDVASRGGAVSLMAQQGLFVDGTVSARAGGTGVEGGRLSVRLQGLDANQRLTGVGGNIDPVLYEALFRADRVLSIDAAATALPATGGAFTAADYAGHGRVGSALVNSSGFDSVQLTSSNTIEAASGAALATRSSLTLDTQVLRVGDGRTLSLAAPTVTLGSAATLNARPLNESGQATGGTGRIEVAARQVDLVGGLALQGVGSSVIAARDDIRLRGTADGLRQVGSLQTAGDLTLSAAQVTPASMTDYTVSLVDNPAARLDIRASGTAPLEPLSAAGSVTLKAPNITVSGRVTAPQGSIELVATDTVKLDPGAVLSVAGTLDVPLGTVFNGSQWVYSDDPNQSGADLAGTGGVAAALPQKRISVQGATVDIDPQARLDLSGGGDTVAQEFVAGPGGSVDIRQNFLPKPAGATVGPRNSLFALIPSRGDHAASFDPQIYADLTQDAAAGGAGLMRIGQTITLGAGSGIPAGTYTVMPVRYALLPGAYAVQPVTGYADFQPGNAVREAAGTVIVAGRLGVDGAGASTSRWSGYRVIDGTQFRRMAELREYSGSAFANAAAAAAGQVAPRTGLDAGALSVAADQIRFDTASIRAAAGLRGSGSAAVTGRGAEIALSAPHLVITDQTAAAAATPGDTLQLNAQALSQLKAETLVLGAAASRGTGAEQGTLTLDHAAQTVLFGGTQALSAGEVLITARDQVSIGVGAAITADTAQAPSTHAVKQSGDGASLLVSDGEALPAWGRSGTSGAAGDLRIAESARLSGRSVLFDASREQRYSPSVVLDARNIGLSAAHVNLGEVPAGASGLTLTNALLAQFGGADSFSITSGSGFDVYGRAQVGSASLKSLTLDGAGFVAQSTGASAAITAGDVTLRNSGGSTPVEALPGGTGTFAVNAVGGNGAHGNITLEGGPQLVRDPALPEPPLRSVAVRGFAGTSLVATGEAGTAAGTTKAGTGQIIFEGKGAFVSDGDLTLDAARIAAGSGADHAVSATGLLRTQATSAASTETSQALGAKLAFSGQRVEHGGRIELPSGSVTLRATGGDVGDDVTLKAGSRIAVAGSTQDFAGQKADASAGMVSLSSAAGSVRSLAGSTIDIAGAGRNGDAGALVVSAVQGTLQLDGSLLARPGTAARGAQVQVDVGRLPDLGVLARPLAQAGGGAQAQSVDVRVRQGDVQLNAGDTVSAHQIRIAVDGGANATRAQDGQLVVNGTLDASGSRGGRVELHARDSIALGSASRVDAHSSGAGEEGGSVLLSARIRDGVPTPLDAIRIADGARIDVSGPAGSSVASLGGTVTLRAPRVGSDVAVAAWRPDTVAGARETVVEATTVKSYTGNVTLNGSGTAAATDPLPALRADLQAFMASEQASARLGAGGATFELRPGLEIRSTGSITVDKAIDFSTTTNGSFAWRYGGDTFEASQPGALTLRAGGDLTLTGGLQDGFFTPPPATPNAPPPPPRLYAGDSWRFQLTAGSDLGAAAASATVMGGSGNVTLQPTSTTSNPVTLRTGTGRIDIAAAQDIVLKGTNVAIYSFGTVAADAGGYVGNLGDFSPSFTEHGGGVTLEAGRDVVATVPSTQLINNWLWRAGRGTTTTDESGSHIDFSGTGNAPTAWWVNAATFSQGVGALGGGDLSVRAGNDVRSLTAVVPTNGYLALDAQGRATGLVQHNGGSLDVLAGGAIKGGAYYAERGTMNLRADRIESASDPVLLAQGANVARLQARGKLDVFGSFNPTWASLLTQFESVANSRQPINSAFTTYDSASALDARSLSGDVSLSGSVSNSRTGTLAATAPQRDMFQVLPGNVDLVAFGGDVVVAVPKLMAPSPTGQLRLLADGSVLGGGSVVMSALDPADLPSVTAPRSNVLWKTAIANFRGAAIESNTGAVVVGTDWGLNRPANHGQALLHEGDTAPAVVVAREGDVDSLRIEVPKPLIVEAAGDVRNVRLWAQNLRGDDVTQVHAGGSLLLGDSGPNVTVTGPGVAEILAGGAINLGSSSQGLLSSGNLINPALPAGGATLIVAAGLGKGTGGFVQAPDYANVLRQFVAYDAFASTGKDAAALNAQVLKEMDIGTDTPAARAALQQALQDRQAARQSGSAFDTWLGALPAATRMRLALQLAQRVQATVNQRFVATANTESFAPGYLSFHDLFPVLNADQAGVRQFVAANPFAGAGDADALRREAVAGLPDALRTLLLNALDNPGQAGDAGSAFNLALAQLDPAVLAAGSRQLVSQVQVIAGRTLDTLRSAGRVGAQVGTPFAKGLDDFARAFSPAGPVARNDITLVFSQIKAEQSGDVLLLAPRGGVVAGLANPPAGVTEDKQAYQLGLLTFGGGDIASMVRDNFDVYRSRVFTVAGGDVHLWASLGNIDAGRGPRDTVVAPPPRLVVDTATGLVTLDVTASVSGSGIGALKTRDDQAPSDIRLIAPNGFIDAGEAGIRADSGTVTLGTNIVLNAGNINAGGGVSGGAVVVAPPAPVPQSSNTAQADKAVEQTQKALTDQQKDAEERAKRERRKRVTGEFIGFGDD